jgi:hypothetical protein
VAAPSSKGGAAPASRRWPLCQYCARRFRAIPKRLRVELPRIVAVVRPSNLASNRVLEKLGQMGCLAADARAGCDPRSRRRSAISPGSPSLVTVPSGESLPPVDDHFLQLG